MFDGGFLGILTKIPWLVSIRDFLEGPTAGEFCPFWQKSVFDRHRYAAAVPILGQKLAEKIAIFQQGSGVPDAANFLAVPRKKCTRSAIFGSRFLGQIGQNHRFCGGQGPCALSFGLRPKFDVSKAWAENFGFTAGQIFGILVKMAKIAHVFGQKSILAKSVLGQKRPRQSFFLGLAFRDRVFGDLTGSRVFSTCQAFSF